MYYFNIFLGSITWIGKDLAKLGFWRPARIITKRFESHLSNSKVLVPRLVLTLTIVEFILRI